MAYRGHQRTAVEAFLGLYDQGDVDEVPNGYFTAAENLRFVAERSIGQRYGVDRHQNVPAPLGNVVRIYNYITNEGNTLLALTWDGTTGKIYHVKDSTTVFGPILTKAGMEDFAFCAYGGRAYISPFKTYMQGDLKIEKGLQNEFLYVYRGDGTAATKAAGAAPVGTLVVANGAAGATDVGDHLYAVVFESDTGYLSAPGAYSAIHANVANLSVSFSAIPLGPPGTVARHIVATKKITGFTGNTTGYDYFFIPTATINDNISTTLSNISFFDADLLENASHLSDNFAEIPAGVSLSLYHNMMVLTTTFEHMSTAYVSFPGEPEAFSQIDGILEIPPDGMPITNAQELRDVLYVFKQNRTFSYIDNDDLPATWQLSNVDQGLGTSVHGVGIVNDIGAGNVDYLLIATKRGISIFTGKYILPELTQGIWNLWISQDQSNLRFVQMVNSVVNQEIYCTLPNRLLLLGDYTAGFDPKNIKWMIYRFPFTVNTVTLVNTTEVIIAAEQGMV